MPAILSLLGRWLVGLLVSDAVIAVVGRIIAALGISFVTMTGVQAGLDSAKAFIVARIAELPAEFLAIASIAKLGTAFSIVFAGFAARLAMDGMSKAGSFISARLNKG
ncbi:DUF2523 family protein [Chitinimonas koreensis]|uniref:DUF2523 family protein n=1 Tax=Chitinimonas koreensis TaxID=356302 RepID=UPI00048C1922|nr:DUF2523 family protein [Chitinimonas koreensis]QNM98682.1 DUF2523 domain-containing protein [Chitinimonas koreensis]